MIEKIRELLKTGRYSIEAIAIELRIPVEELTKQLGIQYSAGKGEEEKKPIRIISGDEGEQPGNKLSDQDIQKIEAALSRIEENLKQSQKVIRTAEIAQIREDIYTIRNYNTLPLEYAKRFYTLLNLAKMHELEIGSKALSAAVGPIRTELTEQLVQIIDEDELKALLTTPEENNNTTISHVAKSKMNHMREKYQQLYGGPKGESETKFQQQPEEQLSEQDILEVEAVLSAIEQQLEAFKTEKGIDKRVIRRNILTQTDKMKNYKSLPLEYATKFYQLLDLKQMSDLEIGSRALSSAVGNRKKELAVQLAETISRKKDQTEDPEELNALLKMLTPAMANRYPGTVGGVKSAIMRKIDGLSSRAAVTKIRTITANMSQVVSDLASGQIDIEQAKWMIRKEAQERVKSAPKNKWALSEEQHYGQILKQILLQIQENPDEYKIEGKPSKAIEQIKQLCGVDHARAARAVVQNLIGREEFERDNFIKAKMVCKIFSGTKSSDEIIRSMQTLERDIAKAEIGAIVRGAVKKEQTPKEDQTAWNEIEYKLREYEKQYDLKANGSHLSTIPLGKSFDGSRKITLADIWIDGKDRSVR